MTIRYGETATAKVENQKRVWQLQKVCRGSQLEKRLACWRRQADQAAGPWSGQNRFLMEVLGSQTESSASV